MHAWEAIQRSVDYVEEHLQENIRARSEERRVGKECL